MLILTEVCLSDGSSLWVCPFYFGFIILTFEHLNWRIKDDDRNKNKNPTTESSVNTLLFLWFNLFKFKPNDDLQKYTENKLKSLF